MNTNKRSTMLLMLLIAGFSIAFAAWQENVITKKYVQLVLEPLVGRTCVDDQDCGLKNGFCNIAKSLCDCNRNFVPSKDNTKCLKVAMGLRSRCIEDEQCLTKVENSICENRKCHCADGYYQIKKRCVKKVEYAEECVHDRQCEHIIGAKCLEYRKSKFCLCHQDTVISYIAQKCFPILTSINDECENSVQCDKSFQSAECYDKKCRCSATYHFDEKTNTCLSNTAYGAKCSKIIDECYQTNSPNSGNTLQCSDKNVCECKTNYYRVDGWCHYPV